MLHTSGKLCTNRVQLATRGSPTMKVCISVVIIREKVPSNAHPKYFRAFGNVPLKQGFFAFVEPFSDPHNLRNFSLLTRPLQMSRSATSPGVAFSMEPESALVGVLLIHSKRSSRNMNVKLPSGASKLYARGRPNNNKKSCSSGVFSIPTCDTAAVAVLNEPQ